MNHQEETSIDLRLMIAYILRKWYIMIVIAIICAGILGSKASKNTTVVNARDVIIAPQYNTENIVFNYGRDIVKLEQEIQSLEERNEYYESSLVIYQARINELNTIEKETDKIQESLIQVINKIEDIKWAIESNNLKIDADKNEIESKNYLIEREIERFNRDIKVNNKKLIDNGEEAAPYSSYDEYLDMRKNGYRIEAKTTVPTKKDIVNSGLLGAIVGLFAGMILVALKYLTSGKIKDLDYFKKSCNIPILRMIYPYCGKRRCFYNKAVEKLEGYINPKATEEEEYLIVASKLNLLLGVSKEFIVTGIVDNETLAATSSKISKSVEGMDYNIKTIENPAENAIDADEIKAKKVVLVAKNRNLSAKRIEAVREVLRMAESEVLGIILI